VTYSITGILELLITDKDIWILPEFSDELPWPVLTAEEPLAELELESDHSKDKEDDKEEEEENDTERANEEENDPAE
jgi:hypothetical protein